MRRDSRYAVERLQYPTFDRYHGISQSPVFQQAEIERSIDFEILNVKPGNRAYRAGDPRRKRR